MPLLFAYGFAAFFSHGRKFAFLSILVAVTIVVISVTRTYILVFCFSALVAIFCYTRTASRLWGAVVIVTVLAVLAVAVTELFPAIMGRWSDRITSSEYGDDLTAAYRIAEAEFQLRRLWSDTEGLLFGYGHAAHTGLAGDGVRLISSQLGRDATDFSSFGYGHNFYVGVLYVGGLLAGVPVIVALFYLLSKGLGHARRTSASPLDQFLLIWGVSAFAGYLANGMLAGSFGDADKLFLRYFGRAGVARHRTARQFVKQVRHRSTGCPLMGVRPNSGAPPRPWGRTILAKEHRWRANAPALREDFEGANIKSVRRSGATMGIYVQYGAGFSAGEGWLNFDASPTLRIQRLPVAGKMLAKLSGNPEPFPDAVRYGDVVKGLPLATDSVDGLYASHVLEHLPLAGMRIALAESQRVLKPGGVFRLIVPDLKSRARAYLDAGEDPEAAHAFLRSTYLGCESRAGSIGARLRAAIGNSAHLWMFDYPAMSAELERAGFVAIRRAAFGDAEDPMFSRVEQEDRFASDEGLEVAIEARKRRAVGPVGCKRYLSHVQRALVILAKIAGGGPCIFSIASTQNVASAALPSSAEPSCSTTSSRRPWRASGPRRCSISAPGAAERCTPRWPGCGNCRIAPARGASLRGRHRSRRQAHPASDEQIVLEREGPLRSRMNRST